VHAVVVWCGGTVVVGWI